MKNTQNILAKGASLRPEPLPITASGGINSINKTYPCREEPLVNGDGHHPTSTHCAAARWLDDKPKQSTLARIGLSARHVAIPTLALFAAPCAIAATSVSAVYCAQTHVQKASDPYPTLVSDREIFVKAHVVDEKLKRNAVP